MTDINIVVINGRLTKSAEFREIGGSLNCRFSVAVNRSRKNGDQWEDEVSYIDCEAWGNLAGRVEGKLGKGTKVTVSGHLRQYRWDKDGQSQSRLYVVADNIDIHRPGAEEAANGF